MTDTQSVETVTNVESEPASLLDMAPADTPSVEPSAQQPIVDSSNEWAWAEGLKGNGEKPDWLNGRYKSVADQAKAYTELEKRFGEFKGAPKEGYQLDTIEGLEKDSPLLQQFSKTFAELNLSQSGFERVVNEFVSTHASIAKASAAEEMKKLGPQGQQMIKETNQWIQNNFPPDVVKAIQGWVMTAEDIKALDMIRSFQPISKIPNASDMSNTAIFESLEQVKTEKNSNWTKYKDDANYRKNLDDRMAAAVRRSNAGKRK